MNWATSGKWVACAAARSMSLWRNPWSHIEETMYGGCSLRLLLGLPGKRDASQRGEVDEQVRQQATPAGRRRSWCHLSEHRRGMGVAATSHGTISLSLIVPLRPHFSNPHTTGSIHVFAPGLVACRQ